MGTSKNKVRIADSKILDKCGATPGQLSFINILNDTEGILDKIAIDKKLENDDFWSFHP